MIVSPGLIATVLSGGLTSQYLNIQLYDVIGYLPEALEDVGISNIDWIVYEKNVHIIKETITLTLIERKTTNLWQFPPPAA